MGCDFFSLPEKDKMSRSVAPCVIFQDIEVHPIKNQGTAVWLHGTGTTTGIVNVGTQELDKNSKSYISEHARFHFDHDIQPGETVEMEVPLIFRETGNKLFRLDLVSELVCWFHDVGSKPIYLNVTVS